MKLTELDPHWYELGDGVVHGLSFDCPHCPIGERHKHRLGIAFHHSGKEAIEDGVIHALSPSTDHIWNIAGDTFENLSMTPSIDASSFGHWHGFITNGEIT